MLEGTGACVIAGSGVWGRSVAPTDESRALRAPTASPQEKRMSAKHGEREGGRQDKREALERGSRRNQPYILLDINITHNS